jgi:subtilisin family serine protease
MQFIIDFKNDASEDAISHYLASAECLIVRTFDSYQKVYLVESDARPPQSGIVESIINDSENPIELLSYPITEGEYYPQVTFATEDNVDWWKVASSSNPDLSAPTQTIDRRGAGAVVYVVDSGVMGSHDDFEYVDVSTLYSFNGDPQDFNGHGTAIASVISGEVCGIADAKIKSVKIFQSGVTTLQSHMIAAFDAILQDAALNPDLFPIVNLSWSIPKNEYIESKIRFLIESGITVVAAAGNNGVPIENVTPASMPEVCAVGAYTQDFEPADFSNYSGDISNTAEAVNTGALDIWAPGTMIKVALTNGGYGFIGGTSIAAAIHSAAVAYNSFCLVLSDGTTPAIVSATPFLSAVISSGKKGILELSEQYQNSVNMVTRFATSYDGDNGTVLGVTSNYVMLAKSGVKLEKMFLNELVADTFELGEPLPDGFEIDNGWIVGTVNVDEPTIFKTSIVYTTHGGRIIEGTVTIVMMPEGMEVQDAGFDNALEINLLNSCTRQLNTPGTLWYCGGDCFTTGGQCVDRCGGAGYKDPEFDNLVCYCNGIPQECE